MQVHQPFHLFLGGVMLILGLLGLGRDAYRGATGAFVGSCADWRSLCLSIFFVADGPSHFSKAFDLPHHESHRTTVLIAVALPIMGVVIIASIAAELADRKRKKAAQEEARQEHGDFHNRPRLPF